MCIKEKISGLTWRGLLAHPLRVVLPLALLNCALLIHWVGILQFYDSISYVNAITAVMAGDVDAYRTPVYPLFLAICQAVFGPHHFMMAAVILQHVAFLVSIVVFDRLLVMLRLSGVLRLILLAVYAFHPGFTIYLNAILTEPFALIGLVMFLKVCCGMLTMPRMRNVGYFFFWLTFLVFLRPSFVYLLPLFLVWWGIMAFTRHARKECVAALCATVLTSLLLMSYMTAFESRYGVRAITRVSTINQYHDMRINGLLDTAAIAQPELKAEVRNYLDVNGMKCDNDSLVAVELTQLYAHYGQGPVQAMLTRSLGTRFAGFMKVKLRHFSHSMGELLLYYPSVPLDGSVYKMIYKLFPVYIIAFYVLLLVYVAVLCRQQLLTRRLPLLSSLMWLMTVGQVLVTLLGAYGAWARLFLPVMPCALLMLGQLCAMFTLHLKPGSAHRLEGL